MPAMGRSNPKLLAVRKNLAEIQTLYGRRTLHQNIDITAHHPVGFCSCCRGDSGRVGTQGHTSRGRPPHRQIPPAAVLQEPRILELPQPTSRHPLTTGLGRPAATAADAQGGCGRSDLGGPVQRAGEEPGTSGRAKAKPTTHLPRLSPMWVGASGPLVLLPPPAPPGSLQWHQRWQKCRQGAGCQQHSKGKATHLPLSSPTWLSPSPAPPHFPRWVVGLPMQPGRGHNLRVPREGLAAIFPPPPPLYPPCLARKASDLLLNMNHVPWSTGEVF